MWQSAQLARKNKGGGRLSSSDKCFIFAIHSKAGLVVQWIVCRFPEPKMQVRFLPRPLNGAVAAHLPRVFYLQNCFFFFFLCL